MPNGYTGRILRIDLSSGKLAIEEPQDSFYRQYFGGEGIIGYFLLKEVPPGVDPLGPRNKLIFAAGPLTGVPVGGCGRHSVGSKSPLTGGSGEAEAGGYWGAELKMAGFDAVIIEGKAESPVYIFIKDGQAEIKDARHLWGLKALECEPAIREELGDRGVRVAQIGPAGEKLVRFACVSNDLDAFAGRTGMGAVMGSKNLKAVACRGHQRISLADPESVASLGRWVRDNAPVNAKGMRDLGTAGGVLTMNRKGGLPTRNFQQGNFEGAEHISGEAMRDSIFVKRRSCYACSIQCKREVKLDEPYFVDAHYGGPEYETIAALGSDCGIADLNVVAKGSEMVNAYGMDSISCGATIAFAMECFERGLLSIEDTGGLDLRFGNGPAMLEVIERIAQRQGLGDLLAEGSARAAMKIGSGAEELALHVRGQELPMHEPRWKQGMGIGYAVSPTGADHCHNMHDSSLSGHSLDLEYLAPLGILEPLPVDDLSPAKVRMLVYRSLLVHFFNCAVCCYFVMMYGHTPLRKVNELVASVTGWDTSVFEVVKVGERAVNLARLFNIREGLVPDDDRLPQRFFTPHASGPLKGIAPDSQKFLKAKEVYYDMMGWPQGRPSLGRLGDLGIEWAAPMIDSAQLSLKPM